MVTVIVAIALAVPLAVVAFGAAGCRRRWRSIEDRRGIALQTVIILVVLLAIAGGVAAILLTRGGEAIDDLDEVKTERIASEFDNDFVCSAAGYTWSSASQHCYG